MKIWAGLPVLFSSPVLTPERAPGQEPTTPREPAPGEAGRPLNPFIRPFIRPFVRPFTGPSSDRQRRENRLLGDSSWAYRGAVGAGVMLRLAFVALANPSELTFHSGGSDAPSYVTLAENLTRHLGFAYHGFPSAVRPPGYPLVLAAAMGTFGSQYILAMRALQFLVGVMTVLICAAVARELFGEAAGRASVLVGLFLPTLVFTTAQLLTECFAAFLTALFLQNLIRQRENADVRSTWAMGWTAGVEAMVRFNAAALPIFAAFAIFCSGKKIPAYRRAAIALGVPLLLVSPWLIRNEIAFHGEVLYSTQGGPNAVQGVLTPEGRTQPGDTAILQHSLGWELHQVETNGAARTLLPSEAVLDRTALQLVPGLWAKEKWHAVPLVAKKLADFWFSADQLAGTQSLPRNERLIRVVGVLAYWVALLAAIAGWRTLRRIQPPIANLLLIYAAGFTLLHLPLVMNTRLRIPLMEPLIVILAGVGCAAILGNWLRAAKAAEAENPFFEPA